MKLFAFFVFIFVFLLLSGCRPAAAPVAVSNKPVSINNVPQTNFPMPPNKPLPEMSWTNEDGQEQKLKDLQGKVVVLDFWATFCPPCREEIPHLNDLQAKYGADKLQIVGLNIDEDRTEIPKFVKQTPINYPLAFPEDDLARFIFADDDSIPQTVVFDRNGILVEKFIGYDLTIKNHLEKAIEKALNQ